MNINLNYLSDFLSSIIRLRMFTEFASRTGSCLHHKFLTFHHVDTDQFLFNGNGFLHVRLRTLFIFTLKVRIHLHFIVNQEIEIGDVRLVLTLMVVPLVLTIFSTRPAFLFFEFSTPDFDSFRHLQFLNLRGLGPLFFVLGTFRLNTIRMAFRSLMAILDHRVV